MDFKASISRGSESLARLADLFNFSLKSVGFAGFALCSAMELMWRYANKILKTPFFRGVQSYSETGPNSVRS